MTAGLYIVGTPIGNLEDISARAIETLRAASVVLTEDTRHTRILLDRYGIRTAMLSCHKFNEASITAGVVRRILGGEAVALVTDSGMPGISDPGSRVATACRRAGATVTVVPGPSAVTAAVSLSGFSGGGFVFAGFAPRKAGALRQMLARLADCPVPVAIYESPYRLLKLLDAIEETLGERPVFLAREMTKKFEEGQAGTAAEIRRSFAGRTVKGEIVLVIAPR